MYLHVYTYARAYQAHELKPVCGTAMHLTHWQTCRTVKLNGWLLQVTLHCNFRWAVNVLKKDQRTVIQFFGGGLNLLEIMGRYIPSVVLHVCFRVLANWLRVL